MLHSLNNTPQSTPGPLSLPPTTPERKASRTLIAPFGPVSAASITTNNRRLSRTESGDIDASARSQTLSSGNGELKDGSIAKDWDTKSFKDCLPILAGLIAQPDFMSELKKVSGCTITTL